MSLIHDALQQKRKPAVPAMQSMKITAPAPRAAAPVLMAAPAAAPYRASYWRSPYVAWGITACVCMVFAWSLFTAARFFNVQTADSSPKMEAAKTFPERLPVRTYATTPVATKDGFTLSGIIDGDDQLAVINDEVVGVGDRIGSALVKEIQGRRVILESNERDIFLTLS